MMSDAEGGARSRYPILNPVRTCGHAQEEGSDTPHGDGEESPDGSDFGDDVPVGERYAGHGHDSCGQENLDSGTSASSILS